MSGSAYFAGAIKRAHLRGEIPFMLKDGVTVCFQIHNLGPWGVISLFEFGEVTTPGKMWQSASKRSLYDFIEARTGVRPPEPERPAKRARKAT